jgi:hypothetical protein
VELTIITMVAVVLLLLGSLAVRGALVGLMRTTMRGYAEELDISEAVARERSHVQAVNDMSDGLVIITGGLLLIAMFLFRP